MCSSSDIKISVIIPAYNMASHVEGAVLSVLEGTLQDIEIIALNDGSTDGTKEVLQKFTRPESDQFDPRVRLLTHENRGKPATLNRGIKLANGNYLAIVDADDEVPLDGLTARYETARHEQADLVIGACEVFRGGETLHVWETPESTNSMRLRRGFYLFPRQPFHLNACLMSRELAERTGPVNTDRERCQDIDLALRLLENARRIATIDRVAYRYRKYRSSFRQRLRLRFKTLFHRLMVVLDNFDGMDRIVGVLASLSFDSLKLLYEMLVGAYPKRASSVFSQEHAQSRKP